MDGLAGHIAGEAALRLVGHRLVEGHVQEAQVRPLLGELDQRGGFARACVAAKPGPRKRNERRDGASATAASRRAADWTHAPAKATILITSRG